MSAVSEDGLSFELERGVRLQRADSHQSCRIYAPEVVRTGQDTSAGKNGGFRMYYSVRVDLNPAADEPSQHQGEYTTCTAHTRL